MMAELSFHRPAEAAITRWGHRVMELILHIGAHRTATTTFQHYMRGQSNDLSRTGISFWGPARTRTGLFHGMFPGGGVAERERRRVVGRVALNVTNLFDHEQGICSTGGCQWISPRVITSSVRYRW